MSRNAGKNNLRISDTSRLENEEPINVPLMICRIIVRYGGATMLPVAIFNTETASIPPTSNAAGKLNLFNSRPPKVELIKASSKKSVSNSPLPQII